MHAGSGSSEAQGKHTDLHVFRTRAPCLDTTPLTPEPFLAHLKSVPFYDGQAIHEEHFAPRAARCGTLKATLAPPVWRALASKGIGPGKLFAHQTEAIDALLRREHVAVCTSTASGKSLCYNVPILQVCDPFH